MGDRKLEVVGLENSLYVGQIIAGVRQHGCRLAQCSEVIIRYVGKCLFLLKSLFGRLSSFGSMTLLRIELKSFFTSIAHMKSSHFMVTIVPRS